MSFFRRLCITVEHFACVDILILKYIFKFAEFKHQVCIASKVIAIAECLRTLLTLCIHVIFQGGVMHW